LAGAVLGSIGTGRIVGVPETGTGTGCFNG
jgi:hypothetical protein